MPVYVYVSSYSVTNDNFVKNNIRHLVRCFGIGLNDLRKISNSDFSDRYYLLIWVNFENQASVKHLLYEVILCF